MTFLLLSVINKEVIKTNASYLVNAIASIIVFFILIKTHNLINVIFLLFFLQSIGGVNFSG